MDNGLIFPYRRTTAQANPVVLRVLTRYCPDPFGVMVAGLTLDPMLVRLAYEQV